MYNYNIMYVAMKPSYRPATYTFQEAKKNQLFTLFIYPYRKALFLNSRKILNSVYEAIKCKHFNWDFTHQQLTNNPKVSLLIVN